MEEGFGMASSVCLGGGHLLVKPSEKLVTEENRSVGGWAPNDEYSHVKAPHSRGQWAAEQSMVRLQRQILKSPVCAEMIRPLRLVLPHSKSFYFKVNNFSLHYH
jgi:hypothetical protein